MPILQAKLPDDVLASVDWHEHVTADEADGLWSLSTRLFQAFKAGEASGPSPQRSLLHLVSAATGMRLTDGAKPVFQPMVVFHQEGTRSPALEDFGAEDAEALATVAATAPTAAVRARLGDVAATVGAEVGSSQWRAGVLAASAYLEQAEAHLLGEDGIQVLDQFLRGLRLAWVYARKDQALHDRYWALLSRAITASLASPAAGMAFVLSREVRDSRRDLAPALAAEIESASLRYSGNRDFDTAASCLSHAADLWQRLGNDAETKRCRLLQGEALVARSIAGRGPAMARATWLAEGIDVLRRSGASRERVEALRRDLAHIQKESLSEFRQVGHSMDATELVHAVEAHIAGPTLIDSLLQLCFDLWGWPRFDKVRQDVLDSARQHPLSALFTSEHVNDEGAVIAQQKALDPQDEESVYQSMVRHCVDFETSFRAKILVLHGGERIFNGHHPSLLTLREIVAASPMTPPHHDESLARGFLGGFNSDWLEAAVYLIPQVEPFVRHQFRVRDVLTLALRDDGTQSEKSLTELLRSPEAERILGKDLILELDTLMVHPMGYKLRHDWAHGLADDQHIANRGVLALWWTMWRLVLWPWALERARAKKDAVAPETAES